MSGPGVRGVSSKVRPVLFKVWAEYGPLLTYEEALPLIADKGLTLNNSWYYRMRSKYNQSHVLKPYTRIKQLLRTDPDRDTREILAQLRDEGFPPNKNRGALVKKARVRWKRKLASISNTEKPSNYQETFLELTEKVLQVQQFADLKTLTAICKFIKENGLDGFEQIVNILEKVSNGTS